MPINDAVKNRTMWPSKSHQVTVNGNPGCEASEICLFLLDEGHPSGPQRLKIKMNRDMALAIGLGLLKAGRSARKINGAHSFHDYNEGDKFANMKDPLIYGPDSDVRKITDMELRGMVTGESGRGEGPELDDDLAQAMNDLRPD